MIGQVLLKVQLNHGSDFLFEQRKGHHLYVQILLVTIEQVPVDHAQIILLETCLRHAHKLFDLIQRNIDAANNSPTTPFC